MYNMCRLLSYGVGHFVLWQTLTGTIYQITRHHISEDSNIHNDDDNYEWWQACVMSVACTML